MHGIQNKLSRASWNSSTNRFSHHPYGNRYSSTTSSSLKNYMGNCSCSNQPERIATASGATSKSRSWTEVAEQSQKPLGTLEHGPFSGTNTQLLSSMRTRTAKESLMHTGNGSSTTSNGPKVPLSCSTSTVLVDGPYSPTKHYLSMIESPSLPSISDFQIKE